LELVRQKFWGTAADSGVSLTIAALITSAVTTLSIGIDNFVGYRDNWVRYSDTWSSLRLLSGELQRETGGEANLVIAKAVYDDFAKRFDKILADSHASWGKVKRG
jgi:hypothetical protein